MVAIRFDADIVVGVDGSDESFAALRWALREAALTGQRVNAVFGWTRSWELGAEPDSDEAWERAREEMSSRLREWVSEACRGLEFDMDRLTLTSVQASGAAALLRLGDDAQRIVVGRRSLGPVARWFLGSTSASLVEASHTPVTVVRVPGCEEDTVADAIAAALASGSSDGASDGAGGVAARATEASEDARPVVVGVDGSDTSRRALEFAARQAWTHRVPLHVLFCWQLRDLGTVPGYENAVAPIEAGQRRAVEVLERLLAEADVPQDVEVRAHAFHIGAAKGLSEASRHASHLVVGSRGLSGLDARLLGSVSKHVVNFAECTVTVVH